MLCNVATGITTGLVTPFSETTRETGVQIYSYPTGSDATFLVHHSPKPQVPSANRRRQAVEIVFIR